MTGCIIYFQALAAGTLLYVTVSEVLPRERARFHEQKRVGGVAQLSAVLVGFAAMYVSTKYLGKCIELSIFVRGFHGGLCPTVDVLRVIW